MLSYQRVPQSDEHMLDSRSINSIADLLDNKFAFRYDPSLKDDTKVDELEFYEKPQDELKNFQRIKWQESLFYWFQQNHSLHPRFRKQEWPTEIQKDSVQASRSNGLGVASQRAGQPAVDRPADAGYSDAFLRHNHQPAGFIDAD